MDALLRAQWAKYDLIYAGCKHGTLMIDFKGNFTDDAEFQAALKFASACIQPLLAEQQEAIDRAAEAAAAAETNNSSSSDSASNDSSAQVDIIGLPVYPNGDHTPSITTAVHAHALALALEPVQSILFDFEHSKSSRYVILCIPAVQ